MKGMVRITFWPDARTVEAPEGVRLLQAAHGGGIDITGTCGGRGRCTSCRVKVLRGAVSPPTIMDQVQLGDEEVREGFRLSCQTHALEDAEVQVAPRLVETSFQILSSRLDRGAVEGLGLDAGVRKHFVTATPPTAEYHQTSDLEEVLKAVGEVSPQVDVTLLRMLPGLLRQAGGKLTLAAFQGQLLALEPGDTRGETYGLAIDIGTTSVVTTLLDLESAEVLGSVSSLNPQAVYGGDLMSRIAFAQSNPTGVAKLQTKIVKLLNDQVEELCGQAGVRRERIYKAVVVGNTCMHHLLLGIDPTHVGLAPYAPVLRPGVVCLARDLNLRILPLARVCLLPIVAGFVGADTVGVILATRIYESPGIRAVVDVGTNGEVVMGGRDGLLACSAPAGPALEGAQIRYGMRAAVGAIDKVAIGDEVRYHVLGDVPPLGICGSGLIDAVAALLDLGIIDPTGYIPGPAPDCLRARLFERDKQRAFVLVPAVESGRGEDLVISQEDIRQVQLAKGAIASGFLTLQKRLGIRPEDLDEVMLAGGFGNYLSIRSALRIGLIPPVPLERVRYVGNAASLGAQMALISERERARGEELARRVQHVSLAAQPDFEDVFVQALGFPAR